MERYLGHLIAKDLQRKLVFVTGPRQVGQYIDDPYLKSQAAG